MPIMDEIILHVGLHKTATTSIQETLYLSENEKLLSKNNYLYPKEWPVNHSIPIYSIFCDRPEEYHVNIKEGYNLKKIHEKNNKYQNSIMQEINQTTCTKLIISGEDISLLSLENIERMKDFLISICSNKVKIRIIIYLRNPLSWSISAIQETVKAGGTIKESIAMHQDGIGTLFRSRVDKFLRVFGSNSVEVYKFEDAIAHQYGPVGHFLSKLKFDSGDINKFTIIRSNDSISLVAGNIISYINDKKPLFFNKKINVGRIPGDVYPLFKIKGSKFDISYNDKIKLWGNAISDIYWLKESTGIDYLNQEIIGFDKLNKDLNEETFLDIKQTFWELSDNLKDLVLEYLEKELKKGDEESKSTLEKLCRELKETELHNRCYLQKQQLDVLQEQVNSIHGEQKELYDQYYLQKQQFDVLQEQVNSMHGEETELHNQYYIQKQQIDELLVWKAKLTTSKPYRLAKWLRKVYRQVLQRR